MCNVNVRKEIVSLVGVNVEGGKLCATLGIICLCHVATSKHSWFLEGLSTKCSTLCMLYIVFLFLLIIALHYFRFKIIFIYCTS